MTVLTLANYIGGLGFMGTVARFPQYCQNNFVNKMALNLLHGGLVVNDDTNKPILGDVTDFTINAGIPNINDYTTASPIVAWDNYFTNDSTLTQTYFTPELQKEHIDTKAVSVSNGFSLGNKNTATITAKASAPFVAEITATASVEVSEQYNFNKTETSTSTDSVTLKIPSQPVLVPPNKKTFVKIYYAELKINAASVVCNGSMKGKYTTNEGFVGDLWPRITDINNKCPDSAVNDSTGLTLNSNNQSIDFQADGQFSGNLVAGQFWVYTREEPLNPKDKTGIVNNLIQSDLIIIPENLSYSLISNDIELI